MWKALWQKWTIDKPAAFGDFLWKVFVVQLAALLGGLTLRRIVSIIPAVILVLAYAHRIPVHPGLMLIGDLLAYIDIFAVLLLLGVLGRVATVLFLMRQATARVATLVTSILDGVQRLDFRHRRERGTRHRKRLTSRARDDNDEPVVIHGVAWA
jgi:hypothetical protein